MTPNTKIRPLLRDDLPAAEALIRAVELFPPELLPDMAEPALSGTSDDKWWITEDRMGLAYAAPERLTDGTWNLLLLAIHPMAQGRGLGRAIVGAVDHGLRAAGGRLLLVETSGTDGFSGTRKFYERLGFHCEARIRDYYALGDDKVTFVRTLAE
jgi:GNAT superfamily N-acetyltransferase